MKIAKTIFREIFITLLVIVAVVLVLGIIFYKFMPTNRVIPAKVQAYATPEKVIQEIENGEQEKLEEEEHVYEITDADLAKFKNENSYTPGKVNPFKEYVGESVGSEGGDEPSTTTPTEQNPDTTDNYYTAAGVGSGTK